MTHPGGSVSFKGTSLTGLDSLTDFGSDMFIRQNPTLPTCAAENLRDRLAGQGWDGTATIEGNDDSGTCE